MAVCLQLVYTKVTLKFFTQGSTGTVKKWFNSQQRFCRTRQIFGCLRDQDGRPPDAAQAPGQLRHTSPGGAAVEIGWWSGP